MTRRIGLALSLASALLPASLVAQQGCATDAAVAQVRQRQADLLQQSVPEMSTEVPVAIQTQIRNFKAALASAVDAGIRCVGPDADAAAIQQSLGTLLGANQLEKPFSPAKGATVHVDVGAYGGELKVAVSTPANAPTLRAVEVSFGIECGADNMLLLYEPGPQGWRAALRWQSGGYADISGAFGDWLLYAVVPGADGLRVAVAHGTAWCTSNISGFKVDLLAPTPNADAPRIAWRSESGYRRESDPRIRALPDAFELRVDVSTIEIEQVTRKGIFRYRVTGDTVQRVRPIAVDGRGFVDAWLQAPWSDAQQWSLAEGMPTFAKVHDAFERSRKDGSVTYAYGPVRACLMKGRYSVEIDADPGGPAFYSIQEGPETYTMVDYSTVQDERCSGPDLMRKH